MTVASPANVDPAIPKEYTPFISTGEVALQVSWLQFSGTLG